MVAKETDHRLLRIQLLVAKKVIMSLTEEEEELLEAALEKDVPKVGLNLLAI